MANVGGVSSANSSGFTNTVKPKEKEEKIIPGYLSEESKEKLDKIDSDNKTDTLKLNQDMGRDQFMHILLKQLANQNPLQPMEDKDFIAQMAQFSSVENLQALNDNIKGVTGDVTAIKDVIKELQKSNKDYHGILTNITAELREVNEKIKKKDAETAYEA